MSPQEALRRIAALHQPWPTRIEEGDPRCTVDGETFPCRTIELIRQAAS